MSGVMQPTAAFLERAGSLGVEFDPGDIERLGMFLALLLDANQRMNLTGITDPGAAWDRHILDAMTLVPLLSDLPALTQSRPGTEGDATAGPRAGADAVPPGARPRVVDVGSGGGVPGLPLAILMPDVRFTLVDSTAKKARFLEQTAATLGLENVTVLAARAEALGHAREHRERYDAAVARAVGPMATLAELLVPLVRVGGVALCVKGAKADDELASAGEALHQLKAVHEGTIDTLTSRVVVLGKRSATPRTYPRAAGEPASRPIGLAKAKRGAVRGGADGGASGGAGGARGTGERGGAGAGPAAAGDDMDEDGD